MSTKQKRKLTFDKLAHTQDTDEPVIRAEFEDTGSFADIIVASDAIRVWYVESMVIGDMKKILDEVCEQLERNTVYFLSPLPFSKIKERVNNYEVIKQDTPKGKQEILKTNWEYEN